MLVLLKGTMGSFQTFSTQLSKFPISQILVQFDAPRLLQPNFGCVNENSVSRTETFCYHNRIIQLAPNLVVDPKSGVWFNYPISNENWFGRPPKREFYSIWHISI